MSFNYDSISESINLKKPNEVYYAVYRVAREKAKQLRKVAMEAYLEAKEIKTKYMLDEFDESESDESEESEEELLDLGVEAIKITNKITAIKENIYLFFWYH